MQPISSEESLTCGRGPGKSSRTVDSNLGTLSQPARVPAFKRAWPATHQGEQMTTTKTSGTAAPAPAHTSGMPVALFSDEASAVMTPVPGSGQRLPRPLDTLKWQAPPALEGVDDDSQ